MPGPPSRSPPQADSSGTQSSPTNPSPPSKTQRPSLRYDAAQRACRDNDVKSLQFLISKAGLFENLPALQEACRNGSWGRGDSTDGQQKFSTTDSIRLSNLLQTATARGYVDVIRLLLDTFPVRDLHVLEWEIVVNAIATGRPEVIELFLKVDDGLVNMYDPRCGTCFTVLFSLVLEKDLHFPMVKMLCAEGAWERPPTDVFTDCAKDSTPEVFEYLEGLFGRVSDEGWAAELVSAASGRENAEMERFLREKIEAPTPRRPT